MPSTQSLIIFAVIGGAAAYYVAQRANDTSAKAVAPAHATATITDAPPSLASLHDDAFVSAKTISERPVVDVRDVRAPYVPIDFTRLNR